VIEVTHPELVAQWHPTRNGDLTPTEIVAGTKKRFWWLCEQGHSWETKAATRSLHGCDCPNCQGAGTMQDPDSSTIQKR